MTKKILLYLENPQSIYDYRSLCESIEFEVKIVHTLEELSIDIHQIEPCLMLLELCLPVFSGKRILNRIQKILLPKNIPSIIISSYPFQWEVEYLHQKGFQEYLPKPFSTKKLFDMIKKNMVNSHCIVTENLIC